MGCPGGRGSARSSRPCLELQELFADAVGFSGLVACPLPRRGLVSTVVVGAGVPLPPLIVCRVSVCVVGWRVSGVRRVPYDVFAKV